MVKEMFRIEIYCSDVDAPGYEYQKKFLVSKYYDHDCYPSYPSKAEIHSVLAQYEGLLGVEARVVKYYEL